jgi:hypothetical protein
MWRRQGGSSGGSTGGSSGGGRVVAAAAVDVVEAAGKGGSSRRLSQRWQLRWQQRCPMDAVEVVGPLFLSALFVLDEQGTSIGTSSMHWNAQQKDEEDVVRLLCCSGVWSRRQLSPIPAIVVSSGMVTCHRRWLHAYTRELSYHPEWLHVICHSYIATTQRCSFVDSFTN